MDYLFDYRFVLGFPMIIGVLTSVYMWFDGKKFRFLMKEKYDIKMTNEEYMRKVRNQLLYHMDGIDFENFMGKLFELNGYKVQITPSSHDFGKDLILNKDIYVECKCYKENKVTSPMINKLIGAMTCDGISKGIFITTSGYTNDAKKVIKNANKTINIEPWDMDDILKLSLKCDKYEVLKWLGIK